MRPDLLSHSWWAMVVLLLVCGALYLSYVFSYLYIWTVSPQRLAGRRGIAGRGISGPASAMLLASSGLALSLAGRRLAARTGNLFWIAV